MKNNEDLKWAISELIRMARRYAEGKDTEDPRVFNEAYDRIRDYFVDGVDRPDTAIENWPYATDSMFEEDDENLFAYHLNRKYSKN